MALITSFSSNPSGAVVLVSCCFGQLKRSQELAGMVLKGKKHRVDFIRRTKTR